ncbi:MAG: GNAT family N-acetyltransferase [Bacteroidia bacterium]
MAKSRMKIKIRKIHPQETYELRHQVMWPDKPIAFIKLDNDKEGMHFGLLKDSNIISIVSLFVKGNRAQFRKFATKTSEQGNGYGTLLLDHLMSVVRDKKIETLWCNARADKTSFYERFGMIQTPQRFVKEGVDFIIMEKTFVKNI